MKTNDNITNSRKGLSKKETYLLSTLAEDNQITFTTRDIQKTLNCNPTQSKNIAYRLKEKKWITPLKRGLYLIVPLAAGMKGKYTTSSYIIASQLADPYYITYWTALNHYGFTEQMPQVIMVATTKRIKNKTIQGVRYEFITLTNKKFFGHTTMWVEGKKINIADKEKTLIDALDHPEYCGGMQEVAKALLESKDKINYEKLTEYAIKIKNGAVVKRLGYLSEAYNLPVDIPKLRGKITKGYSALDTLYPGEGKHNTRWNLIINYDTKDAERDRLT